MGGERTHHRGFSGYACSGLSAYHRFGSFIENSFLPQMKANERKSLEIGLPSSMVFDPFAFFAFICVDLRLTLP